jgi:hypothetical protein
MSHAKSKEDPVRPLTEAERRLVRYIDEHWNREQALSELRGGLQTAIEIELATVPIYLFAYYSIDRTPKAQAFPATELSRFADRAGGIIMSVAVEEMLHMSLSSNVLFSLGALPQLYLRSPAPYPTDLPGHAKLGPDHRQHRPDLFLRTLHHQFAPYHRRGFPTRQDAIANSANQLFAQQYRYGVPRCELRQGVPGTGA